MYEVISSKIKNVAVIIILALLAGIVYLVTDCINIHGQCKAKSEEIAMMKLALDHPNVIQHPTTDIKITEKKTVKKDGKTYVDYPGSAASIIERSTGDEFVEVTERVVEYMSDGGKQIINSWSRPEPVREHKFAVGPMLVYENEKMNIGVKAQMNIMKSFVVGVGGSQNWLSAELLYRFW